MASEVNDKMLDEILELKVADEEEIVGTVNSILTPTKIKTKFGEQVRIPISVKIDDKTDVVISLFVKEKTLTAKKLHPRSSLAKLLMKYRCKSLKELVGKKVLVRMDNRGFYRIVY